MHPDSVNEISKMAKNFKFSMDSKYIGELDFLFQYFIDVLVSKLQSSGNSQSILLQGKAFIFPGSLHANGESNEFSQEGGMYVRVKSDDSVVVSESDDFNEELAKDMWLPWLPVWPKSSVGLISKYLSDDIYVVQLIEEKKFLENIIQEEQPNRELTCDPSFGLWKWSSCSGVRVCSNNMECTTSMCSYCHRVTVGERCICMSLETRSTRPFFTLNYSGESYRVRFRKGQVLYVNPAVFTKCTRRPIVMYIKEIVGPILHLVEDMQFSSMKAYRKNGVIKRLKLHFLSPNINVVISGVGPIHTLKLFIHNFNQHGEARLRVRSGESGNSSLCSILSNVELSCFKCGRGPICSNGCNWCGSFSVGYQVCEDSSILSSKLEKSFEVEYVQGVKDLFASYDLLFNDPVPHFDARRISTVESAKVFHQRLTGSVREFRGMFEIKNGSYIVNIVRSDSEHHDFFRLFDSCAQMKKRLDYAHATQQSSFGSRLSTWVSDNSVLRGKRDEEIEDLARSLTRMQKSSMLDQLESMQKDNSILSDVLEVRTIHNMHDPSFPFCKMSTSVLGVDFDLTHLVTYMLNGFECTVSAKITVEKRYTLCNCRFDMTPNSNMLCSGPFMGIYYERFCELEQIINSSSDGLFHGSPEEHVSMYFLNRIHNLKFKNHMDPQIFVLYIFCMFSWYAISGRSSRWRCRVRTYAEERAYWICGRLRTNVVTFQVVLIWFSKLFAKLSTQRRNQNRPSRLDLLAGTNASRLLLLMNSWSIFIKQTSRSSVTLTTLDKSVGSLSVLLFLRSESC